ncbi:MAG: protein TolR [Deltaproteobacteria bacterium SG8_13]|nr:MAG: protein TolR [Deltaproteobacteria bacterium SG8_13]
MMIGGRHSGFMSEINVTPFVDVMLVLLIIFMVTAPMMMQGVDVTLPEASAEAMAAETEPLMLSIDKQSRVFINDINVSVEDLHTKLEKILSGRSDREVFLKADKEVPYGTVVRIMSEIKAAGVEKLGMVTLPVTQEAATKR